MNNTLIWGSFHTKDICISNKVWYERKNIEPCFAARSNWTGHNSLDQSHILYDYQLQLIYDTISSGNGSFFLYIHIGEIQMTVHTAYKIKCWGAPFFILYTGKYSPPFYFCPFCPRCQRANLRLGNFQSLTFSLFKTNLFKNSRQDETVWKWRRAKIIWGLNNPVYSIYN